MLPIQTNTLNQNLWLSAPTDFSFLDIEPSKSIFTFPLFLKILTGKILQFLSTLTYFLLTLTAIGTLRYAGIQVWLYIWGGLRHTGETAVNATLTRCQKIQSKRNSLIKQENRWYFNWKEVGWATPQVQVPQVHQILPCPVLILRVPPFLSQSLSFNIRDLAVNSTDTNSATCMIAFGFWLAATRITKERDSFRSHGKC